MSWPTFPGGVSARFTGRAEGDLGHAGAWVEVDEVDAEVMARRAAVCPLPWTWLRQVHGDRVVVVASPGQHAGQVGDAVVTDRPGCAVAVLTADCAPVLLAAPEGIVGVAHAGWRGLLGGVLQRAVEAMRSLGSSEPHAVLGPCIRPECYEFGLSELEAAVARLGEGVRGVTTAGRPALDLPAGVRAALAEVGVGTVEDCEVCTACSRAHFSHRRRGELERQALVAWISLGG